MDWEDPLDPTLPDPPVKVVTQTGIHQGDFMGNLTLQQARKAVALGKPFFVHVTPVMPHWGTCYGPGIPPSAYSNLDPHWEFTLTDPTTGKEHPLPISPCPSDRHRHAFDNASNPHIKGVWNVSITGPRPDYMKTHFEDATNFDKWVEGREDLGWRNRSASLLDLDHMLGEILIGLEDMGVLDNTFVIFSAGELLRFFTFLLILSICMSVGGEWHQIINDMILLYTKISSDTRIDKIKQKTKNKKKQKK